MAERPTPETFQPFVGQTFKIGDGRYAFELANIEVGAEQSGWGFRPFTLIFQGPPGDVLPEGMYALAADGGAGFDLYLMPIHTPAPGRQDYQSVFA
jgi:hypothetical protein